MSRAPVPPPPVTYEEVDVGGVSRGEGEHRIELKSNEAYGPLQSTTIVTSHNQAY